MSRGSLPRRSSLSPATIAERTQRVVVTTVYQCGSHFARGPTPPRGSCLARSRAARVHACLVLVRRDRALISTRVLRQPNSRDRGTVEAATLAYPARGRYYTRAAKSSRSSAAVGMGEVYRARDTSSIARSRSSAAPRPTGRLDTTVAVSHQRPPSRKPIAIISNSDCRLPRIGTCPSPGTIHSSAPGID